MYFDSNTDRMSGSSSFYASSGVHTYSLYFAYEGNP